VTRSRTRAERLSPHGERRRGRRAPWCRKRTSSPASSSRRCGRSRRPVLTRRLLTPADAWRKRRRRPTVAPPGPPDAARGEIDKAALPRRCLGSRRPAPRPRRTSNVRAVQDSPAMTECFTGGAPDRCLGGEIRS
jgi:hypothetical protein